MSRYPALFASAFAVAPLTGAAPAKTLTIDDTFGSSVTGASNAPQIEATIQAASNAIASLYANPITVRSIISS